MKPKVDLRILLAEKLEDEDHTPICIFDAFDRFMSCLGAKRYMDNSLTKLLASRLQIVLPLALSEALVSKGMQCEIAVKTKTEQAEYFFDIIAPEGNALADQKKEEEKNPTKMQEILKEGVLQKMSPSMLQGLQARYFILVEFVYIKVSP